MRIRQINFKVSDEEREVLNSLIVKKGCSLSDVIREAVKEYYDLEEFNASYTKTANKRYKNKWSIY
ncbi:ribbon-helix-helix protein, CopG family [Clostridium butyricum]|uniref:ribbon-helix-helix protein, CopG family n=1 Tax=Clostridium butyricum TaxID=1492 RepID=UPI00189DE2E4|nr:ribbon-helix-helix protein, CopG family [Clostridium butyricum]MDB2153816.1 ribbon-helix-helix protein, CopG family [Clostridium butyricum]